uniref:SPIN-DOC-like zinc-finger domain-containing protein n=1 Tax=Latimeria chalumnae TaxID=7897 RepID=H3B749_LATCH
ERAQKNKTKKKQAPKEWKEQYFFIQEKGDKPKPVCLICGATAAIPKEFNLERHYKQNHGTIDKKYLKGSDLRKDKITREEIIKESLRIAARNLGDSKVQERFDQISPSLNTVMRIEEMADDVSQQIRFSASLCKYFLLTLDDSIDNTSTVQSSVFICCVNKNFDVIEELLNLESLKSNTRGTDLFDELKASVELMNLNWDKLKSICTDGAPSTVGKNSGGVAGKVLVTFSNIIHQESLLRNWGFHHVMSVVVQCINKIYRIIVNSGTFWKSCEVCWLSKGKMLQQFSSLMLKVIKFLQNKKELPDDCALLKDDNWLNDLAFLTDITCQINSQYKTTRSILFSTLVQSINAFKMKLMLFKT